MLNLENNYSHLIHQKIRLEYMQKLAKNLGKKSAWKLCPLDTLFMCNLVFVRPLFSTIQTLLFSCTKCLFFMQTVNFSAFPQPNFNHHFHHCLMPNPIYLQLQIKSFLINNLWLKHKKNFTTFNEQQLKNTVTHKKSDS